MQKEYLKPALSIDEQMNQLQERGMVFNDVSEAKNHLETISYYRLSGYWHTFRMKGCCMSLKGFLGSNRN